jgi:hypothetical protein
MHHKAHVRLRAQARPGTDRRGSRADGASRDPADRRGQLVALGSFAERPAEMRWERRFAPPALITNIRGDAAARRLDRCN